MGNNNEQGNDQWKNNARLAIYAMAGFYLLMLAYQLFELLPKVTGNQKIVTIVGMVAFVIIGIGMIVFSTIEGYRNVKKLRESWEKMPETAGEEAGEDELTETKENDEKNN